MQCIRRRPIIATFLLTPALAFTLFKAAVLLLPCPAPLTQRSGAFLIDRHGLPLAAFVSPDDGQWRVPLTSDDISPHLIQAIIAVEDARFLNHAGVDWRSAAASLWDDLRHLSIRRGGSTLTMQLRRLRDPRPRTLWNKLDQAIRAQQIERREHKTSIVVEYLNRAPFGGNLVGAGAASWRYFGRPCRDLSLAEAALLAGLPQSPNRLRPDRHPDPAKKRRDHVLDRMLAGGMLTTAQHADAVAEPITAAWRPLPQDQDIGALPALIELGARHAGGGTFQTTLDRPMQELAFAMARDQLESLKPSGVTAAAVVVLDTATGECRASVSLHNRDTIDLTRRPRSTGSTLKPFIYAAAFDAGIATPQTILLDAPSAWPGYVPSNYDRTFVGPLPASNALAESRNIPALFLLNHVGVERMIGTLDALGFSDLARARHAYGLSLATGGAEATPLQMAQAYATLARGGVAPAGFAVLRREACWQALSCINQPTRTADVSPEAARLRVAWKTGTSSGHRDAWCAAVTPRLTVVAWFGNTGGQSSSALIGQEAAAPAALRIIATLDPGGPPFPEPAKATDRPLLTARAVHAPVKLVIASPSPGQRVLLNPDLPPDRQQLRLETPAADPELFWFVDDLPIARGPRAWYSPTPGPHRIRLADANGHAAVTDIRVDSP